MGSNGQNSAYLFSIVLIAVIGGLLFGYDTAVISGAEQALDTFFKGATDFTYTKLLHGFTVSSALLGCIIGGAISGMIASSVGRKKALLLAGILFFVASIGSWRPESGILPYGEPSLSLLIAFNIYRIIGGIGVGLASAICPMYIAEISPANIRGTLVSCNQFAIIFGMLVVYFVNYLIRNNLADTPEGIQAAMVEIGWRRMFLSNAFPAAAFFFLVFLVPETPRFLVMKGKESSALKILTRINGSEEGARVLSEIKGNLVEKREKLLSYGRGCIHDADGSDGNSEYHLHARSHLHCGQVRQETSADHRLDRHDDRNDSPGHILVHGYDRHRSTDIHHHIHRILHDVMGPDLLGAHFGNIPEHYPFAGSRHRCSDAMGIEFPRLIDFPVSECLECRRHISDLCDHGAALHRIRLEIRP